MVFGWFGRVKNLEHGVAAITVYVLSNMAQGVTNRYLWHIMNNLYSLLFEETEDDTASVSEDERQRREEFFELVSDAKNLLKMFHGYKSEADNRPYGIPTLLATKGYDNHPVSMLFQRIESHQFYYDLLEALGVKDVSTAINTKPAETAEEVKRLLFIFVYDIMHTSHKFLTNNLNTKKDFEFIKQFLIDVFLSIKHLLNISSADSRETSTGSKIISAYKKAMSVNKDSGERAVRAITSQNKVQFKELIDYIKSYKTTLTNAYDTPYGTNVDKERIKKKVQLLERMINMVSSMWRGGAVSTDKLLKQEMNSLENHPYYKTLSKSFLTGLVAMIDKVTDPTYKPQS